jgi:predicted DNA-binding mobile mystery protein A
MRQNLKKLQIKQMDQALAPWHGLVCRPAKGWISAIRQSLGMSASALSRRLRMTPAGVMGLEKAEAKDAITLTSLRKLAEAMDCELHYALVPRTSLEQIKKDQALKVAKNRLKPVQHSMRLENQAGDEQGRRMHVDLLAEELMQGSGRELW